MKYPIIVSPVIEKIIFLFSEYEYQLCVWPHKSGWVRKGVWLLTWPIHLIFMCTIPDCEKPKFKNWFPVTFIMCIVWIGSLSYLVAWMITIIGKQIFANNFYFFCNDWKNAQFFLFSRRYLKDTRFGHGNHIFSSRHECTRGSIECHRS